MTSIHHLLLDLVSRSEYREGQIGMDVIRLILLASVTAVIAALPRVSIADWLPR